MAKRVPGTRAAKTAHTVADNCAAKTVVNGSGFRGCLLAWPNPRHLHGVAVNHVLNKKCPDCSKTGLCYSVILGALFLAKIARGSDSDRAPASPGNLLSGFSDLLSPQLKFHIMTRFLFFWIINQLLIPRKKTPAEVSCFVLESASDPSVETPGTTI